MENHPWDGMEQPRRPVQDMGSMRQKPVGYDVYPPSAANRETVPHGYTQRAAYYNRTPEGNGTWPAGPQAPDQTYNGQEGYSGEMPMYGQSAGQMTNRTMPPQGTVNYPGNGNGYPPAGYPGYGMEKPPYHHGVRDATVAVAEEPFGEQNEAPELAEIRSTSLNDKTGPFWDDPEKARVSPTKKVQVKALIKVLLAFGIVLVTVLIILYSVVFRVKNIVVEGNETIPASVIIQSTGIRVGDSIFAVNPEQAKRGIDANRYLVFESVETEMPSSVRIRIRERHTEAVMNYCGVYYSIDGEGVVLEETEDLNTNFTAVVISGMNISGAGCTLGRVISASSPVQMMTMKEILLELRVLSMTGNVRNINISDLDNILMETRDGYSVRLGNHTNIHAKLKSAKYTVEKLISMGQGSGSIDVSDPENPSFIPE